METYGKLLFITIIIFFCNLKIALTQVYYVNCYTPNDDNSNYYAISTKAIDLESKNVIDEIPLATEGEILNIKPVPLNVFNRNILLTAINSGCYCKNTAPDTGSSRIICVNVVTGNILNTQLLANYSLLDLNSMNFNRLYVSASGNSDNVPVINGIYGLTTQYALSFIENAPVGYTTGSLDSLNVFTFPRLIHENIYYDSYDEHYYVIKTDPTNQQLADSLRCRPYKSSNHLFAVADNLLYVFNLNYEIHFKDKIVKGYGQNWIDSSVKIYDIYSFNLLDSISVPDYSQEDYISGSSGVTDVIGNYIVYYFGQSNDLENFAPAMLFIFDTRTNEAAWLRVGWR